MQATPLLNLLRRLEAQNVWRMTYNVMPQQSYATATAQYTDETSPVLLSNDLETAKEWYEDSNLTAQEALKLLVDRIRMSGPVSTYPLITYLHPHNRIFNPLHALYNYICTEQRHLQYLYQRCQSAEELEKALRLTRLNYLARGELQQHDPFSYRTSATLLHEAMRLGAPELAQKALLSGGEFGLPGANARHFNQLLIYHSKHSDLQGMLETYELMKRAGPRPDSETCFILVKGCVDAGRDDLAKLVVNEFDTAGVRVRNGTRLYIEQHSTAAGQE